MTCRAEMSECANLSIISIIAKKQSNDQIMISQKTSLFLFIIFFSYLNVYIEIPRDNYRKKKRLHTVYVMCL